MNEPAAPWQNSLRLLDDALCGAAAPVRFWWRDDDASEDSDSLGNLLDMAEAFSLPLCLAVIPKRLKPSLVPRVLPHAGVSIAVHGWMHKSYAPEGQPTCEFPAERDGTVVLKRLGWGRARLEENFGARVLPLFVPPWNRFAPVHEPLLVKAGYRGLSTSSVQAPSVSRSAAGLAVADAHFNVVRTSKPPALGDVDAAAARMARQIREGSPGPFGVMTHHKAHFDTVWRYLGDFWSLIASHRNARCASAADVFGL